MPEVPRASPPPARCHTTTLAALREGVPDLRARLCPPVGGPRARAGHDASTRQRASASPDVHCIRAKLWCAQLAHPTRARIPRARPARRASPKQSPAPAPPPLRRGGTAALLPGPRRMTAGGRATGPPIVPGPGEAGSAGRGPGVVSGLSAGSFKFEDAPGASDAGLRVARRARAPDTSDGSGTGPAPPPTAPAPGPLHL